MFEGWAAAAGIGAAASLAGGAISAAGAESAASTQAGAAENAQQISENEFNTITGQNAPFMQSGYGALSALDYGLGITPQTSTGQPISSAAGAAPSAQGSGVGYGSLTQPFNTTDWQQLSPQYNFNLQQGQQNVLNADAAGQGSLSGAALKDLTNYNQSAANNSFNSAFANYTTQQNNIFGRLSGIAQLGQSSANNTGQQGTALAGQAAQSATNVGTALAGGTVGATNAISGGLTGAAPWLAYGAGGTGSLSTNPSWYDTENPSNFQDFTPSTGQL